MTHSGIIARIIFDFASSLFDADETWLYFTTNLLGTCVMNWGKKARGNPTAGWKLINNIYDTVHIALWSMLLVAIIFFCLFTLPKIRQTQGQREVQQVQAIAAENRHYCEKWGFPVGTDKYTACTLDLQELRAKIEQRVN